MEFRRACPADVSSLYALWARSFPSARHIETYGRDADRFARTFVAIDAGEVVAAIYYLPRWIRNTVGGVDLVGGITNIAGHPRPSGEDHVHALIDLALRAMVDDGCAWSLLLTDTPERYLRSGYRPFTLPYTAGRPARPTPVSERYRVLPGSFTDWAELAEVHEAFDTDRPLTTARTSEDWRLRVPLAYAPPTRLFIARAVDSFNSRHPAPYLDSSFDSPFDSPFDPRLDPWPDPRFDPRPGARADGRRGPGARADGRRGPDAAAPPGRIAGYLVARWSAGTVRVIEAATRPGASGVLESLFSVVAMAATAAGVRRCEARLPADRTVLAALPRLITEVAGMAGVVGMVRPVCTDPGHLRSIVEASGAFHWPADHP